MAVFVLICFESYFGEWGITCKQASLYFHPPLLLYPPFLGGCKHFLITSRFPFSSWCWWDLQSYGGAERYMELIHRDLDNTGLRLQRMCASNTKKSRLLTTRDQEKDVWCVESESKHHEQRCMRKRERSQSETSALRRRRSTGSLGTGGAAAELPLYWLYKVILHCWSSRRWTK